ncbi:hypothetical protein V8C26DRAFT_394088 [Trichoderma gracile]
MPFAEPCRKSPAWRHSVTMSLSVPGATFEIMVRVLAVFLCFLMVLATKQHPIKTARLSVATELRTMPVISDLVGTTISINAGICLISLVDHPSAY